ncbi:type I-E CRISPR-associated protein Cse2/CasB [Sanguibacter sp. Z1732]|uniref:type I-E CRISPR-associated protein Cse2/CasB n=1 Tax=Sanguibacter sp. Z1732 TaxID=3435412 RepID=UPI003D9C974B
MLSIRRPGSCLTCGRTRSGSSPRISLAERDDPSPAERAAHHALTLFALHRQGKADIAHSTQVSFGGAIRELARRRGGGTGDESPGVRRRFDALVTASTPDEGAYHLRGLVMMLRDAGLSMDYGRLAQDLADLWTPARRDGVRLRWARQYRSRSPRANDDTQDIPTTATTEERS